MIRPSVLLACGLTVAALGLSACGSDSESASSDVQQQPAFTGSNAEFCGALLAANDHSAAAEQAKANDDVAGVQASANAMFSALQDARAMVPGNASDDVKPALKKYLKTLERAMAGEDLGDQARKTVKKTTKAITAYYDDKCRLAE